MERLRKAAVKTEREMRSLDLGKQLGSSTERLLLASGSLLPGVEVTRGDKGTLLRVGGAPGLISTLRVMLESSTGAEGTSRALFP